MSYLEIYTLIILPVMGLVGLPVSCGLLAYAAHDHACDRYLYRVEVELDGV